MLVLHFRAAAVLHATRHATARRTMLHLSNIDKKYSFVPTFVSQVVLLISYPWINLYRCSGRYSLEPNTNLMSGHGCGDYKLKLPLFLCTLWKCNKTCKLVCHSSFCKSWFANNHHDNTLWVMLFYVT